MIVSALCSTSHRAGESGHRRIAPHCCVVGFDARSPIPLLTRRRTWGIDPRSLPTADGSFGATEDPDAQGITVCNRAQRRRLVGSTERSAARGRVRLLGYRRLAQSLRAEFQAETGIAGAGPHPPPIRQEDRWPAERPEQIRTFAHVPCAHAPSRALRAHDPATLFACGAHAPSLFDIVDRPDLDAGAGPRRPAQGRFHTGSGSPRPSLSICMSWLSSSGRALAS